MTLIIAYTRERLLRRDVAAIAALIAIVAHIARGEWNAVTFVVDLAAAFGLVFAFRAWDDVMDRERDRLRCPERVVVRARSLAPLAGAAALTGIVSVAVVGVARGRASVLVLAAFSSVLAVWYAARGPRSATGDRLLLSKYGFFTLALIGATALWWMAMLGATSVYVVACLHEWRHDRESRVFSAGGFR